MGNISARMLCAESSVSKCKTQAACEAGGECHGGLRKEYCYDIQGATQGSYERECERFPYVCVMPQLKHPQYGHMSCEAHQQKLPGRSWDRKVHTFHGKCVNLHNDTQAE